MSDIFVSLWVKLLKLFEADDNCKAQDRIFHCHYQDPQIIIAMHFRNIWQL